MKTNRNLFTILGIVAFAGCQPAQVSVGDTADNAEYVPSGAVQLDGSEEARAACLNAGNVIIVLDGRDLDGYGTPFCVEGGQETLWNQILGPLAYDCNELDATINPGATEVCNLKDDDCDLTVDDGVPTTSWFVDADTDGYGLLSSTRAACMQPTGYVASSSDCDDTKIAVHPGATETCNGLDDNCVNGADESGGSWYADVDVDGFGNAAAKSTVCAQPAGTVANNTDCDDTNAAISPADAELCNNVDDDCNGVKDNGLPTVTEYRDADADTYGATSSSITGCSALPGYVLVGGDCNDVVPTIKPGAAETCNSTDDDCDGIVDEAGGTVWYKDGDGDGSGTSGTTVTACVAPSGYVAASGDCLDTDAAVKPGATEVCDGKDNDCDALIDEGAVNGSWYADTDHDGYGAGVVITSCAAPSGTVANNQDCNDGNPAIKPTAAEVCDGIDQDCDGVLDDGLATATYYKDNDRDGYGGTAYPSIVSCAAPSGYYTTAPDCNDTNISVNPGIVETANGVDDNCDGTIDNVVAACATGFSKLSATFTASSTTGIVVTDIYVDVPGYLPFTHLTNGSPAGVTTSVVNNTSTFAYDVCVPDSTQWRVSETYHYTTTTTDRYTCEGGKNSTPMVASGTWVVKSDGVTAATPTLILNAANPPTGCDTNMHG